MISLFEMLPNGRTDSVTDVYDLSSEFASTEACCEEGQCCIDPW